MAEVFVSLLMTAYNREKYIGQAIESVIASTFQNWELIIVDDGSKDKTVELAREYERSDSRIKVYLNEKNLGDYPNRNQAASYARGKYIKYIDADDSLYYWGLQVEVEMMEMFPDAGYGLDSIEQDDTRIFPFMLNPMEAYKAHYFKGMGFFVKAPVSSIIKRDTFEAVGGFTGKRYIGDFELWHRLSLEYPVVLMPHGIVWSRGGTEDQESHHNRTNRIVPFLYLMVTLDFLKKENCPLDRDDKKSVFNRIVLIQSQIILRTVFKERNYQAYLGMKKLSKIGLLKAMVIFIRNKIIKRN